MYRESAGRIFYKYAVPQMIGLLFNSTYIIVDGVFIGNRLGSSALAAAGVAVPAVELLIAISMAVTAGSGVVVSGRLAAGSNKRAVTAFNSCLALQVVISLIIAVTGNIFIHPLARMLGSTPEIHGLTVTYLRYLLSFCPFLLFSYLLGGLVRNDNNPRLAMIALSIGSVSNIILDWLFMYPLNMGIGGAALATALGPIISVIILLPHFICGHGVLRFKRVKPVINDIRSFLYLGFPSFIMEFSIGMVTFVMNLGINRYGFGETGLAAYLIIGYLLLIIFTLFLGMAEGLQPAFSYMCAAGDADRLKDLKRFSVFVFLAVGIVSYLLVFFFSARFYGIFTPGAPGLAAFAASQSRLYFVGFPFAGLNILMISYYQSTAVTGRALLLSSLRGFILPAALIFTLPLTAPFILWGCHSFAEIITFAVYMLLPASALKVSSLP